MLDTVLQNIIKLSGFDKYHISQEHFMFDPNTKKLYDDITNIGSSFGLVSKAILLVKTTEDVTHFSGLKINIETEKYSKLFRGFKVEQIQDMNYSYLQFEFELIVEIKGILNASVVFPSAVTDPDTALKTSYLLATIVTPISK